MAEQYPGMPNQLEPSGYDNQSAEYHSRLLIRMGWGIEIVGVGAGIVNSFYTTFGDHPPPFGASWLAMTPLALLASTELLRIPLTQAFCRKRGMTLRGLALTGVALAGLIAVENWTFGMERIVNWRLNAVTEARAAFAEAKHALDNIVSTISAGSSHDDHAREKLRDNIELSKSRLGELASATAEANKAHIAALAEITAACKLIPGPCIVPRTTTEDARYGDQMRGLADEQQPMQAALTQQQRELESRDENAEQGGGHALAQMDQTKQLVATKEAAVRKAATDNQIYRIAAIVYGVEATQVTDAQLSTVRGFFCVFSATLVSFAGTVAAMVFYMREKARGVRSDSKLARSLRALLYRLRKRVVRTVTKEVPVEIEVTKEVRVEVPVEKEIRVEVPVVKEVPVERILREVKFVPYTGPTPVDELHQPRNPGNGPPNNGGEPRAEDPDEVKHNVTPLSDWKKSHD